ncbi:conserved hypothetical protein [Hyphomicrobiales bacterium]|nr:conserved hypothetical protein [Hyphomicrobiales bacterium]
MSDAAYALSKQMDAAKILREQIADIAAGDPDFIRDTLEGETNLHEAISALVLSISEDDELEEGVKRAIDNLKVRKDRFKRRAEMKRALVATAMEIGEIAKIETPAGTVTAKSVPPKAIVTEESEIPTKFFETPAPVLSLKKLTAALKEREALLEAARANEDPEARREALLAADAALPPIPGASLSNGGRTIQITKR